MAGSRRFISKISVLILLTLMTGTMLFATETRVNSLGGRSVFIYDDTNIFNFPATLARYSGMVIGELRSQGVQSSYSLGAHIPLTREMDVAVYLNRPFDLMNLMAPINIAPQVSVNSVTDVFWSSRMANNMDVGARLTVGMDSYSEDLGATDETQSARYIAIGAGISNEMMDAGILIDLPGEKRERDSNQQSWSAFGIGLNARAHLMMNNALTIVPAVLFTYRAGKTESDVPNYSVDYGQFQLFLGVGLRYSVTENNLFILGFEGIGLSRLSEEQDNTKDITTEMNFPGIYLGVESQITNWLVGRLGARQLTTRYIDKMENDIDTSEKSKSKSFALFFGVSVQKGNFILDAAVNEGLLFDSVYFISGIPQEIASQISLVYLF